MKKIIDGVTYNTETSTLIATKEWRETEDWESGLQWELAKRGELYQTRSGTLFTVSTLVWAAMSGDMPEDVRGERAKPRFAALTHEQAQEWILGLGWERQVEVELLDEQALKHPPEPGEGADTEATLYIRLPRALKDRIEARAKISGSSVNAWAMRCLESCFRDQRNVVELASLEPKAERCLGFAGESS